MTVVVFNFRITLYYWRHVQS